jgi:hypothetical protein
MEEDNVSTICSNHSNLRLTKYTPFPRKHSPGKHTIQTRSLLSTIGKQDHKTRSFGGPGTYQAGSSHKGP